MGLFSPSLRDFPEEFNQDNGCYMHTCSKCELNFLGHKRRVICKICVTKSAVVEPVAQDTGKHLEGEKELKLLLDQWCQKHLEEKTSARVASEMLNAVRDVLYATTALWGGSCSFKQQ